MTRANSARWTCLMVLCAGLLLAAGLRAEDEGGEPPPTVQRVITHPLAKALVGTWSTRMTGSMTGSGTANFALGVGDTCLLQDEHGEHGREGSSVVQGAGHGVYRISEDGKSITGWWIDNKVPDMIRTSGPLRDTGFDLSGEIPGRGKFRVVLERTAGGFEVKSYVGDATEPAWTQVYERAGGHGR